MGESDNNNANNNEGSNRSNNNDDDDNRNTSGSDGNTGNSANNGRCQGRCERNSIKNNNNGCVLSSFKGTNENLKGCAFRHGRPENRDECHKTVKAIVQCVAEEHDHSKGSRDC